MPHVDEVVLGVERGYILAEKNALLLVANQSFVDIFGKERLAGDQWLVTRADSEIYIPDVYERVQSQVSLVSLTKRQYCIVRNPYDSARHVTQWGAQRVQRGQSLAIIYHHIPLYTIMCQYTNKEGLLGVGEEHVDNFFLRPGEELVTLSQVLVLNEDEALKLCAVQGKRQTCHIWRVLLFIAHTPLCRVRRSGAEQRQDSAPQTRRGVVFVRTCGILAAFGSADRSENSRDSHRRIAMVFVPP